MRTPGEIGAAELAEIVREVRERMIARTSAKRVAKFMRADPPVAEEFARQTWLVVREHLERA